MFLPGLTIMNKRLKYFISSFFSALGFFMFVSLPYESRYFGLMVGIVWIVFCFWFGLGILFEKSLYTRVMAALLPTSFFVGFGLFGAFLTYSPVWAVVLSLVFGVVLYLMFLVENVFLVAIGFKTVPLYRAAYTVSLMMLLLASFFLFDSMFSYRLSFWMNGLWTLFIGIIIFLYQFWAISIELPDDGKNKRIRPYVIIPSVLLSEMAMAFSFWPTGIFKGSVYLVVMIYVMSGLIQADIRDRLFRRVWLMYAWIGAATVAAILMITNWR